VEGNLACYFSIKPKHQYVIFGAAMRTQCDNYSAIHSPNLARRSFLKLATAAAFSSGFLTRSQAAESNAPPKAQNVLSSKEALERLMEGNDRYVEGKMKPHD
jgi:carbonic anhydrase